MDTIIENAQKLFEVKTNGQVVYWTTDYGIFQMVKGNRPIYPNHVKALKKSILENGWIQSSIITVGDKHKVYDGQHRLYALREVERETGKKFRIGYIVDRDSDLKRTQILNNHSRNWKMVDYAISNSSLGNVDYRIVSQIVEQFDLSIGSILSLIYGRSDGYINQIYRTGGLKIANRELLLSRVQMIDQLKPYFKNYNTTHFLKAFVRFLNHDDFSFDVFLTRLKANRNMLYPAATVGQYLKMIQDLYNFRSREKKIFFNV